MLYIYRIKAHLRFQNKSEIVLDDEKNAQIAANIRSELPVTLVCIYDDIIKNPKDQIKWYFNKHRIRNALDESNAAAAASSANLNIKILNRNPLDGGDDATTAAGVNQFTSTASFTPNHHFTIIQSLTPEKNATQSTLLIHNFNLKYNFGRYRCQYRGLIKTVKIYPNHRNGIPTAKHLSFYLKQNCI